MHCALYYLSLFTVQLHVLQRTYGISKAFLTVRRSACPSVCLSVSLSVKRVYSDNTRETCAHILIPDERTFILFL